MATSKMLFNNSPLNTYVTLGATDDLNDLPRNVLRLYYLNENDNRPAHCPADAQYAHMITFFTYQFVIDRSSSKSLYFRRYTNNQWGKWAKITGEETEYN